MNNAKPQLIVWWALWASFQMGVVFIYYFLGQSTPQQTLDSPAWLAGLVPFVLSAIVRWIILPRIGNVQAALSVTIIGIALSEACCFFGLFLFPAHKQTLFGISFAGIFQFMPIFAARYYQADDRNG